MNQKILPEQISPNFFAFFSKSKISVVYVKSMKLPEVFEVLTSTGAILSEMNSRVYLSKVSVAASSPLLII